MDVEGQQRVREHLVDVHVREAADAALEAHPNLVERVLGLREALEEHKAALDQGTAGSGGRLFIIEEKYLEMWGEAKSFKGAHHFS